MESLGYLKPELLKFLTTFLKLKLRNQNFDPLDININHESLDEDSYYQIIIDNWAIKVKDDALTLFVNAIEGDDFERLDTLAKIITSPHDKSICVNPYFEIAVSDSFVYSDDETLIGDNFTGIDDRFDRLFNLVSHEFQHIAKNLTAGATAYNKDGSKVKDNDIYIHFNTKNAGEKTEFFITCGVVPAINKSGLSLSESATARINDSLRPMPEDKKEELFDYPSANKEKAAVGITVKDEIESALDRINDSIKTFISNKDTQRHPACLEYAVNKINSVLIPLIATLQLEPYGFFGGMGDNIFDTDSPNANTLVCSVLIDEAVTALFKHLDGIPKTDDVDHYALDVDNFGIYARNEKLVVLGLLTNPKYTFSEVFEPYYSLGFLEVFKRYLKTVKNKYVFSQIGKIDESSITDIKI